VTRLEALPVACCDLKEKFTGYLKSPLKVSLRELIAELNFYFIAE